MNSSDRHQFAPFLSTVHNLRERPHCNPDHRHRYPNTMALRNYMLNLVSDCAQTNETSVAKMSVTIVSDNTVPSLRNDLGKSRSGSFDSTSLDSESSEISPKPSTKTKSRSKGTPQGRFGRPNCGSPYIHRRKLRKSFQNHPDLCLTPPVVNNSNHNTTTAQ